MSQRSARSLLLRCMLLVMIGALPVVVSVAADPAHLLGTATADHAIAAAVARGQYVTDYMNYDDRDIERWLVALRGVRPDVLAIGSSRLQVLSHESFPGQRFINASVSNARFDDIIGLYALYDTRVLRPRRLVVTLDPWTLTPGVPPLWESLVRERGELLARMGERSWWQYDRFRLRMAALKQLATPQYFRLALYVLGNRGARGIPYRITAEVPNENKSKLPDGSVAWPAMTPDMAARNAREFLRLVHMGKGIYTGRENPEPSGLARLERFLGYVRNEGVDVVVVFVPFNPIAYREFAQRTPNPFDAAEESLRQSVARAGVRVVGSFNPQVAHVTSDDLFDESHLRPAALARLVAPALAR